VLPTLIEAYEDKHCCILLPDPIEAIIYHMQSRKLSIQDLVLYICSRELVTAILKRKYPLSIEMIRRLNTGLDIPAEILIQPYKRMQAA
jgi:HTH-type transcriptional regulator/antitoxin HigA